MKTKLSFIIGLFLIGMPLYTHAQLAIGQWKTHFAYNSITNVEQTGNKVFALSDGSLFSVDKFDESIEFYSKVNGLNGSGISKLKSIPEKNELIIVYSNGNIDILTSGGIFNIPDLYNKTMGSSKTINDIFIYGDKAFLSCDFGILAMNLNKREIAETYYIGNNSSDLKILNTVVCNNYIYALSEQDIYLADVNNSNLVDFQNWNKLTNLPGTGKLQSISVFANHLLLCRNNVLYRLENDASWTLINTNVVNTKTEGNKFFLFNGDAPVIVYSTDFTVLFTIENLGNISDVLYDESSDNYWFAANMEGVKKYKEGSVYSYLPSGPALNSGWDMVFSGEKLFVVPGSRWFVGNRVKGNIMMYENGEWTNITANEIQTELGQEPYDFTSIAIDPDDNSHFFVTSYSAGLYEFRENYFYKRYSGGEIETLSGADPYRYTFTDGAIFDSNKNLFFVNPTHGTKRLKVFNKENIISFTYSAISSNSIFGKILIPSKYPNQKWIPLTRANQGIFIYDDLGDPFTESSKTAFFSSFPDPDNPGAFFAPLVFYCVAEDKDGTIWLGTDKGPFLFYNISKVFDEGYSASRVKIPKNDGSTYADYLLENEKIRAIAIDGANRKWIGTEETGVYLLSENGQETIHHFTTENSPLPSNAVTSIAINPISGEVFLGTANGIVSFQSDAAESSGTFKNVYAYPNPVRENYNGVITITGLIKNTNVKITDLNGNLICETISKGSLATWDGKDKYGRKVSTGIYLAICVTADGTESAITKILVIN